MLLSAGTIDRKTHLPVFRYRLDARLGRPPLPWGHLFLLLGCDRKRRRPRLGQLDFVVRWYRPTFENIEPISRRDYTALESPAGFQQLHRDLRIVSVRDERLVLVCRKDYACTRCAILRRVPVTGWYHCLGQAEASNASGPLRGRRPFIRPVHSEDCQPAKFWVFLGATGILIAKKIGEPVDHEDAIDRLCPRWV